MIIHIILMAMSILIILLSVEIRMLEKDTDKLWGFLLMLAKDSDNKNNYLRFLTNKIYSNESIEAYKNYIDTLDDFRKEEEDK